MRVRARVLWANEGQGTNLDDSIMVVTMTAQDFARLQAALHVIADIVTDAKARDMIQQIKPLIADLDSWATS